MKSIARLAVLTICTLASAMLSDARAWCDIPGTSFTSWYFDAPIAQDPALTKGNFWGLGQFDPATLQGSDNGLIPSSEWLRYTPSHGFYLAGDWAAAWFDGCIQDPPNPQPAAMGAMWTTSDGNDSYFVAMCAIELPGLQNFNTFCEIGDGEMQRVPKAVIHSSSQTGSSLNLMVGHEPLGGSGVYRQGGCSLAVTGFRVYGRTVPHNAPAPSGSGSRSPDAGWTQLGEGPEGSDVAVQTSCESGTDLYLMATLVVDGNVALQQGSRNSTPIQCVPSNNDEGDGFRFVRRPKSSKGR